MCLYAQLNYDFPLKLTEYFPWVTKFWAVKLVSRRECLRYIAGFYYIKQSKSPVNIFGTCIKSVMWMLSVSVMNMLYKSQPSPNSEDAI